MKLTLATILFTSALIACGGGGKKGPTTTGTGDTGGGDTASTGDKGGGEVKPPEPPPPPDTGGFKLIIPADLAYQPLNPEGPGPEMAVVYGDPTTGASAFFLRIPAGAKAGVHNHSADYQAVVVQGTHKHWLAGGAKKAKALDVGSHWFQPGGQAHDDECAGKDPCILFIVSAGKFDMSLDPKAKAPKVGNYKMNLRKDAKWAPMDPSNAAGPKVAVVHGDPTAGPNTWLIEVPPGFSSGLHSHTANYHAVLLDAGAAHWLPHEKGEGEPLSPGSYWFQPGGYDHGDRCSSETACHGIVFMEGALDFKPAAAAAK